MSLLDGRVDWDAGAELQERMPSTRAAAWVGERLFEGTIAGAIRVFATLPLERQERVELFVDHGVIAEASSTILGFGELAQLASRTDLPMDR